MTTKSIFVTRLSLALAAFTFLAAANGCSTTGSSSANSNHNARADGETNVGGVRPVEASDSTAGPTFTTEFRTEPADVKSGEAAALLFTVKDAQGKPVRDLQVVHEKPMHLLLVSNDLSEFHHLHPEPRADGAYRVEHTFAHGGAYKLFADFTPPGAAQVVERQNLMVAGNSRSAVELVADKQTTKTVENLQVTMQPDKPLRAGEEVMLDFAVADERTKQPVTDLQPYLGALAHFVIISADGADFLHAHPMEKTETISGSHEGGGGDHNTTPHAHGEGVAANDKHTPKATTSEVSAHTSFPRPGLYKVWAQFQRGGRVSTVPFVVRVAAEATESEKGVSVAEGNASQSVSADAIKVTVSEKGYEPSRIEVKKGQPVKLAFYRKDANNCGGEVVFPATKMRRKLPVGKTTVVELTPQNSGELAFTCGMGMMRGALVVVAN
ncbi:MAG: cupredoxin domain-containing protein [Pyrinomonadaceae bacterium]